MIYTIGFTKSTAEHFFERLKANGIQTVLDVRLKNNSQLAGFARMCDIGYLVKNIVGAEYIYDPLLAPSEELLAAYRKKEIDWAEYERRFEELMNERKVDVHLIRNYADANERRYCLLCSEDVADYCHRRLVARRMANWFGTDVIHL